MLRTTGRSGCGRVVVPESRRAALRAGGWWGDHCLLDWWQLAVAASPDALAVVDRRGERLTYAEVDERSSRLAGWLVETGVRPGETIGVQLPAWTDFLVTFVAIMKAGAVVNPLATNLRRTELTHAIDACSMRLLVMPTCFRRTDYGPLAADLIASRNPLERVLFVGEGRSASGLYISDAVASGPLLARGDWVHADGDDVAAILFTSGSEADPKGVMLTHNNLIASEVAFAYALRLGPEDRMLMPAPLGHATGFMHGVIMPMLTRGTSLLCDSTDGSEMAAMIRRHKATCGMSVPSVIDSLLCVCETTKGGLESVRFLCCGGSPVPRRLLERARALGVRLYSVYGSTESAPHTLTSACDTDERVLTTDGRACPGTEIRVVDPKTRRTLPPGVEGEEASRGPAVFAGYLGRPDLTRAVLDDDGWYYSGDLAVMDADGYVRITGRRSDVINRGGEKISPTEIERVLMSHPAVRAAAVVGMPDDVMGQRACAYLVARGDAVRLDVAALVDYFVGLGIAKFKIPERVEYLDEMPLTPSGKIAKGSLKRAIAAEYARASAGEVDAEGVGESPLLEIPS